MDQKQIEDIVRNVMASMGQSPAQSSAEPTTSCEKKQCAAPAASASAAGSSAVESCSLDLGSAEAKAWIGVENPHRAEVLTELRRSTAARVCTGRAGPRPRTQALLRFLADHSRSKDTVLKEVPAEWIKAQGLLEVQSEINSKNLYLTRPDMGRSLSKEAIETLKSQCTMNPDVQVVISDGLSTDAITANYEEILPPLLAGLKQTGLKVGKPFFVRYGRVKIEDQIGEILGAKVVILLVGERPGLGQSESLSCYAVYSPQVATTVEADRTCISNIHRGGTPPVEAAGVIVDLAKRMLEQKASGINMTR
ncbi:ethanolamine ammonia-lyase subunit EutC [Enterobacteriaceae bacterium ESL0689]|nr:ethanolamine ammonia-lyase subunit EutC [Enterobacteriaceae bacterium ESL0689]